MPGITLVTNAPPEMLRDMAKDVSQSQGYDITPLSEWSLRARRGNVALSWFFGAFVPYCDFKAHVIVPGDGTTHFMIERNTPWWTGWIGVSRVKSRHADLVSALQYALGVNGVSIMAAIPF